MGGKLPVHFQYGLDHVAQWGGNVPGIGPQPAGFSDFISIFFGSKGKNQGFDQAGSQTMPGLYFAGGKFDDNSAGKVGTASGKGNVSLRMLPYFNRMYLQAELAQIGAITGDAKAFLSTAINATFAKVNAIATTDGSPTIAAAGAVEQEAL